MASVNKVILMGNCGRDPETRFLPNGTAVCNLSLATTSKRKDKTTGDMIEETQWHRLTFFERLAEIVGQYVKTGTPIYIEGRLKYRRFNDASGVEKFATDIVVTELQLLGGKQTGEQRPAPNAPPQKQAPATTGFDDMDDDIPF